MHNNVIQLLTENILRIYTLIKLSIIKKTYKQTQKNKVQWKRSPEKKRKETEISLIKSKDIS